MDLEPGLHEHLLCRRRAPKIWAQLVDGTIHTSTLKHKSKHKRLDPPRGAVPRALLVTSLQAFSKYLVVYVYLNGSMLVPSP